MNSAAMTTQALLSLAVLTLLQSSSLSRELIACSLAKGRPSAMEQVEFGHVLMDLLDSGYVAFSKGHFSLTRRGQMLVEQQL